MTRPHGFQTLNGKKLALSISLALGANVAQAETYTVNSSVDLPIINSCNDADSTGTSLREAVCQAEDNTGADTINFSNGLAGAVIRLTQGQLEFTESLNVDGGTLGITITGDANGDDVLIAGTSVTDVAASGDALLDDNSRVFLSESDGVHLTLNGLTLTGGRTNGEREGGGAIAAGEITLVNSTVSGNSTAGNISYGGGIYGGHVAAINSTISGNSTAGSYSGGGGIGSSSAELINSTVTGNVTLDDGLGGGISVYAELTLINSIVLGNRSVGSSRDDIAFTAFFEVPTFNVTNSIDGSSIGAPIVGTVFAELFDNNGVDGGVLADNGGPVPTVALSNYEGNPAIDGGDDAQAPAMDARGEARRDAPGVANNGANISDIGAFELQDDPVPLTPLIVTTVNDIIDAGDGLTSLREAVAQAEADSGPGRITFDVGLADATIRLTQGQLEFSEELIVDGAGLGITITGDRLGNDITDSDGITDVAASSAALLDDNSRIFYSDTQASLSLIDLTLTGGRTSNRYLAGGAIRMFGNVTISGSTISGNSTGGFNAVGGGIFTSANVSITNSVVSNNFTYGSFSRGGGINAYEVTVTNSTLSGNHTAGQSSSGAAIYAHGLVKLSGSMVSDNSTAGELSNGAIQSFDGVILNDSTISGNSTTGDRGKGGGVSASSYIIATNSTISGNSTAGDFSSGGGLYTPGDITLINSTISGNSTNGDNASGGGISANGMITLTNSTISGNFTTGNEAYGGGISGIAHVYLNNSIVMGNITTYGGVGNDNIQGDTLTNTGNLSLDGDDASAPDASVVFRQVFDNNGVNAGVLADNGGPVQTIALRNHPDNPALDAGDDATAPPRDARGVIRFDHPDIDNNGENISDLGAFELQSVNSALTLQVNITRLQPTASQSLVGEPDGTMLEYQINVHNAGPDDAAGINLSVTPPRGMDNVLWECEVPFVCDPAMGANSVNSLLNLAQNESVNVLLSGELVPEEYFLEFKAQLSPPPGGRPLTGNQNSQTVIESIHANGVFKDSFER